MAGWLKDWGRKKVVENYSPYPVGYGSYPGSYPSYGNYNTMPTQSYSMPTQSYPMPMPTQSYPMPTQSYPMPTQSYPMPTQSYPMPTQPIMESMPQYGIGHGQSLPMPYYPQYQQPQYQQPQYQQPQYQSRVINVPTTRSVQVPKHTTEQINQTYTVPTTETKTRTVRVPVTKYHPLNPNPHPRGSEECTCPHACVGRALAGP